MHAHRCGSCGMVFYHSNEMQGNVQAHKCPACGKSQWQQFQPENAKLPNFPVQAGVPVTGLSALVNTALDITILLMLGVCVFLVGYGVYKQIKEGGIAA